MSKSPTGLRRTSLAGLATTALVVGAGCIGVPSASADASFAFDRIAGQAPNANRFGTSVEAAKVYGASTDVILANGEAGHYPDALTANYLSGSKKAPVLLTKVDTTPDVISSYLQSSGVKNITIVGGPLAVSDAQEANLTAAGYTVDRIQGTGNDTSRYGTARSVSGAVGGTHDTAVLTTGEAFPDAVASGPLSYTKQFPLTITKTNTLPQATKDALTAAGVKHVVIAGGLLAVSQTVEDELTAMGIDVTYRAAGTDRSDTSAKLAQYELDNYGFTNAKVNVASGQDSLKGADALSGGPVTGLENRALLITKTKDVAGASVLAFLTNHADTLTGTDNHIFGGPLAVSDIVEQQMEAAAQSSNGQITLSSTSVQQGGTLTGTITGDNIQSVSVKGCGLDQAIGGDSDAGTPGRQFSLTLPPTQAAGACSLVFTITHTDGTTTTETKNITVTAPAGPVVLTSTSAAAGSSISGTIANPGTIERVSVTGCGFNNEGVAVAGDGTFSVTVPRAQAPGSCTLTFNILRSDGTTQRVDVPFTVAAAASSSTAGPDLVSASVDTTNDVVTYSYDENVTGKVPNKNDFYIYNDAGQRFKPTLVSAPASGSTVIAQFGSGVTAGATLAAADTDAVEDSASRRSYAASEPLNTQNATAGITNRPDLVKVDNVRIQNNRITADFTFDSPVTHASLGDIKEARFGLIVNDATAPTYTGINQAAVNVNGTVVTVAFYTPTTVPLGSIVRGVVNDSAVRNANGGNVTETEGVTQGPAQFSGGAASDRTSTADITSVSVASTHVVTYTFDEAVTNANAGQFYVYDKNGTPTPASSVAHPVGSTSVLNVTFPGNAVGTAVGAGAFDNAVQQVAFPQAGNKTQELPLQSVSNTAGRTDAADLVSVKVSSDAFGVNKVVYTFDSVPTNNGKFYLVDAEGVISAPMVAFGTVVGNTVVFNEATGGFTDDQAATAVIGSVQDTTPGQNAIDITTGDAQVQR